MGKGGRLFGYSGKIKSHKELYEPMYKEGMRYVQSGEYGKAGDKAEVLYSQNSTVARQFAAKLRVALEKAQKEAAQKKK